ncbi:MAG: trimethylamine methyltransferase family protein, partial [Pseudomonadota bacterium]
APTFGTPEASQVIWGAGQLARRLGLPYRSGGGFCGSKIADAQAGYESANSLNAALLGGVNFMLHSCGWLEGGLVASFEKFVMDADQLGALQRLASGIVVTEDSLAMDAIREVGPGGHYLGCDHTQAHFRDAFWRSDVLDYRPFETWESDGGRDTRAFAAARAQTMLDSFEPPSLDAGILEALEDYTARKKAGMADALS